MKDAMKQRVEKVSIKRRFAFQRLKMRMEKTKKAEQRKKCQKTAIPRSARGVG